jgi:hypothetical protein
MQQNPPINRLKYVAKTYGAKSPGVVMDTFFILSDVVGIEHPQALGRTKGGFRSPSFTAWNSLAFKPSGGRSMRRVDLWEIGPGTPVKAVMPPWTGGPEDAFWLGTGPWANWLGGPPPVDWSQSDFLEDMMDSLDHVPEMHEGRESDALWPWVAQQLNKGKKRAVKTGNPYEYVDILNGLWQKGPALALWQQAENIDLGKYTWDQALEALESFEVESGGVEQGEVIYEWPDGWTMQRLDEDQLEQEGEVMQHCVGSYCEQVSSGRVQILSLRDPKGEPHVTIEYAEPINRFLQVQGKQNRDPIPEYQKRVDQFAKAEKIKSVDAPLSRKESHALHAIGSDLAISLWSQTESYESFDPRNENTWSYTHDAASEIGDNYQAQEEVDRAVGVDWSTLEDFDEFLDLVVSEIDEGAETEWNDLLERAQEEWQDAIDEAKARALDEAEDEAEVEDIINDVLQEHGVDPSHEEVRGMVREVIDQANFAEDDEDDEDDD